MDIEGIILTEISQLEKDKYHMISLIYEINLRNKANKAKKRVKKCKKTPPRLLNIEKKLEAAGGKVGRVWGETGEGIKSVLIVMSTE